MMSGVTERAGAEEGIQASDAQFRSVIDALPQQVWTARPDGTLDYVSVRVTEYFGVSSEALLGMGWQEVIHPIDLPECIKRWATALRTGDPYEIDFRLRRVDGMYRWHIGMARPLRDDHGAIVKWFGTNTDITERKLAQAEVDRLVAQERAARIAAAEADARAAQVLESVSDAFVSLDRKWCYVYVNEKAAQIFGRRAQDLIGKHIWTEFPEGVGEPFFHAYHKAAAEQTFIYLEEYYPPYDRWFENRIYPSKDGISIFFHDISDRKRAEETRTSLESQLRESQKIQAVGTLAGGIAHDFNNILGAILGNLELIRQELGEGHPALANLEQIGKSGRRARSLITQILTFSRKQPQVLVSRPLHRIVEEAMGLLRATLPAGVRLELTQVDTDLHILADATQLQQVLMNLCTNAWHALQGNSGHVNVGLDAVAFDDDSALHPVELPPGRYAHLWVHDNGSGMDAVTRARIFEPFYTTKPVGQGTGLGLSVVHGIVTAHQGAIVVDSTPGHGSTFHLYFPLSERRDDPAPSVWSALEPEFGAGQHVLYIDDDQVMLTVVEQLLERLGYRVTCCENALAALATVRAQPASFDLVVTDFNMPEYSGLQVARELACIRPGLPVVISSGYVTEEMRAEATQLGVRGVLQKENTFEALGALVHRVLSEVQA